jgi:hypothetical protein
MLRRNEVLRNSQKVCADDTIPFFALLRLKFSGKIDSFITCLKKMNTEVRYL